MKHVHDEDKINPHVRPSIHHLCLAFAPTDMGPVQQGEGDCGGWEGGYARKVVQFS